MWVDIFDIMHNPSAHCKEKTDVCDKLISSIGAVCILV